MANFTPQEIGEMLQEFFDTVGKRQYVGARYVPVFGRHNSGDINWDNSDAYEPLTIVYYNGDTYTSRKYVPAGIDIYDTDYWVVTGRYNAQVEQYRQEVLGFSDRIDGAYDAVDSLRIQVAEDYVPFPDALHYSKYGTEGQVLNTLGDGTTKWEDPVTVTSDIAEPLINDWLDDHPEATTTVQDGAITTSKLADGAVTKPKMNKQGIPLEQQAIINGLMYLMSALTGEALEIPFIQGKYGSTLTWASDSRQICSEPFILPNGVIIEATTVTAPTGRSIILQTFEETSEMSGTYARVSQQNANPTVTATASKGKIYNFSLASNVDITPSDGSGTILIKTNPNTILTTLNSLSNNAYLKRILPQVTDVNEMTKVGGYVVDTDYDNVPADINSNGTLHCFTISNTRRLQILSVGGNNPTLYFRTWKLGGDGFSPWNKIYPIAIPESIDIIKLTYSDTDEYTIDLGAATLLLRHWTSVIDDADLWNVNQPRIKASNTLIDNGDIIGPIRVDGGSDFTFGIHGSATTTLFAVYMDGVELTLGSDTDISGKELVIFQHDEGRDPDDANTTLFERDVTIRITRGKMWVSNTITNVSGNALTINTACNGGLIAAYKNLINGISTNGSISKAPYNANQANNPHDTSCTILMTGCTMTARNIIGHELATYNSKIVNYSGTPGRNKIYFNTGENFTMANGDSIYGEFEYEYR